MRYVRCENCKRVVKLLDGEWECIYCGNDLAGSDIVAERVWRESLRGIVMQCFGEKHLKASTQTAFVKESFGEKHLKANTQTAFVKEIVE